METSGSGATLPYRVVNESHTLLAFQQPGNAHWDLLGAGESCGYVFDAPDGERALRLYARDPAASFHLRSEPYRLDRLGRCEEMRVDSRLGCETDIVIGALAPDEAVLLTKACRTVGLVSM
jgi:hypothetical protein